MSAVGQAPTREAVLGFLARTVDAGSLPGATPDHSAAVLDGIAGLALDPGAPVLVALPNGRTALAAFFGVLLAGGTPVMLPPAAGAGRVGEIARSLGGAALVAPRIDPVRHGATTVHPLGGCEAVRLDEGATRQRYSPGEVVLLTSGTSGIATGCLHGLDALLRNAGRHAGAIGQRADDTVLVSLPLHYSYGLVAQALASLVQGSRLVVSGPPFTPRSYAETLRTHEVTVSSLTPSTATALVTDPPRGTSLRVLTVGGDALDPTDVGALLGHGPQRELYVTYGLTEAGPRVSTLAAHREPEHRWSSVGLPLPGVRTRLEEPTGDGPGAELVVASDTVLRRRLPAGTRSPLTATGEIRTGDRFDVDAEGYHYFRGRSGDSVVVGGEKIWLPSVRRIAARLPGVRRCTTTVYRDDRDELRYGLDVAVDDPGPRRAAEIEHALRRVLLRAERPHRITLCRATTEEWHK